MGDYGGQLQCGGLGGAAPATLAHVSLHHSGDDQSSYGVSVVDGFNVGLSVTPHEGRGNCPVLACRKDLTQTCPGELQVRAAASDSVTACKSGCLAFDTDELSCGRNAYNSRPPAAPPSTRTSSRASARRPSPTPTTAPPSPTSAPCRASSRSSSATRVESSGARAGGTHAAAVVRRQ
uniref:Uncharacterized protein n=1 Tax=Triticum urartu TaxID=4572 RepID=A0A8R7K4A4_TRIUA